MRIAVNGTIADPFLSGLGVYTVSVVKEMVKLYGEMVVYTSCPEVWDVDSSKVRLVSPKVRPCRGRRGHLRRLVWVQASLPFRVLADRASLLFSPVPEVMLMPTVPQVVVVHDLIPMRFPDEFPRHVQYFRYLLPVLLKRCRAIVADSEHTKRDLTMFYGIEAGKIRVVPCGYDRSRYRPGIDVERVKAARSYLLYVGILLPHKNLRQLLKGFAFVAPKLPHTLIIAGRKDPRYYPALEAEVRLLGLEGRVSFLDYVPADELPALYAGADMLILPSLWEGFGLPVLEAMACGTPVVATDIGPVREVVGDAGFLIDPADPNEMADAVLRVVGDEALRTELIARGFQRAARFSWEATARQILLLLEEVRGR